MMALDFANLGRCKEGVCAVKCRSPRVDGARDTLLRLSLNGQDYSNSSLPFRQYLPPGPDTLEPSSGPRAGGTRIVIEGDYLGGGTDYRCRIAGGEDVAGVEVENEFGSRYSDFTASPHIECVTPPRDGAASDVEAAGLSISLNKRAGAAYLGSPASSISCLICACGRVTPPS